MSRLVGIHRNAALIFLECISNYFPVAALSVEAVGLFEIIFVLVVEG